MERRIKMEGITKKDFRTVWACCIFPVIMAMTIIPSWFVRAIVGMVWMAAFIEILIYAVFDRKDSKIL